MPKAKALKSRLMDDKDARILMLLQKDGRMQLTDIAKKVSINIDSVHRRMKAMQDKGIFSPTININPRAIGYPLLADVKVRLKNCGEEERLTFIKFLQSHDQVIYLLAVMGDYDFTCVLIARNSEELESLSVKIRQKFRTIIDEWKGILILKTYKSEEYNLK